jgi:exosome complex component RRP41
MGGYGDVKLLNDDGSRLDGRAIDEMRPVEIRAGVLPVADGSAYVKHGLNEAIVAVYGPMEAHPRRIQLQDQAVLDVRYNMAPFSTSDRIRPGFNRRSREISKVTAEALASVVLVERYPRSKIRVEIEILSAEAGTRCVGITAAAVALADAGIPMRDLLVGVAAGKVEDTVVLDLDKAEDNYGQADLPMGIMPATGEIAFMQMDGDLSMDELNTAIEYCFKGAADIYELQKAALKDRYNGGDSQ